MAVQLAGNAGDAGDPRRNVDDPPPPLKMPASPERAARDIAAESVEGRPADATAGPKKLRLEMLAIGIGLVVVSVAVGIFANWVVGGVMLVVGFLALLFNPVMGATAMRSNERQDVATMEQKQNDDSAKGGG